MRSILAPAILFISNFLGCATPEPTPVRQSEVSSKEMLDQLNATPSNCEVTPTGTDQKDVYCSALPKSKLSVACQAQTATLKHPAADMESGDELKGTTRFAAITDTQKDPWIETFATSYYAAKLFAHPQVCGKEPGGETVATAERTFTVPYRRPMR